jgi:hypothetical protein
MGHTCVPRPTSSRSDRTSTAGKGGRILPFHLEECHQISTMASGEAAAGEIQDEWDSRLLRQHCAKHHIYDRWDNRWLGSDTEYTRFIFAAHNEGQAVDDRRVQCWDRALSASVHGGGKKGHICCDSRVSIFWSQTINETNSCRFAAVGVVFVGQGPADGLEGMMPLAGSGLNTTCK